MKKIAHFGERIEQISPIFNSLYNVHISNIDLTGFKFQYDNSLCPNYDKADNELVYNFF